MRAVWLTRHGGPEVLQVRESRTPEPAAGQVRIRVAASSVSYSDVLIRRGLQRNAPPPPCILGYEGAGVIDRVGADVTRWQPGARVAFLAQFGAQASLVCVPERQVATMPDDMSFEQGAVLPLDYLTAHHALFEVGNLRPGRRVLIQLAASSLGRAALQLCSTVERAVTFGTANPRYHEQLRAQGCQHPLDASTTGYAQEVLRLTDQRGVDLLLDPLGGPHWRVGYSLLRPGGTLVVLGAASLRESGNWHALLQLAKMPRYSPLRLLADCRTIAGVDLSRLTQDAELIERQLSQLTQQFASSQIRPQPGARYPCSRAGEAHAHLERDGADSGRPVLLFD